jgi:hypothetical protein
MVTRRLLSLPIILSLAALVPLARATDYPIAGKIHIVKDTKLNKMVAPGSYTIPSALGPSDPTVAGGALTVVDTGDSNGFSTTLGAAGWTGLGNPAGSKGYKYKGAGAGSDPCKIVLVKSTIIKFVCKDDQALDPPLTATSFITLSLGTDTYCAEFGGTTIKNVAGLLKRKDAAAPASCVGSATTSTSSTTSTTIGGPCCNSAGAHRFTAIPGGGDCGDLINFAGVKTKDLTCGGLYVGGGGASVPTATLPDMETFITNITSCTGQSATLGAATSSDTGSNEDCTAVGCLFGPPLPIPSPATTPTSTCVVNVVATNGMGTLDCNGGAQTLDVPLSSIVYLTGDTATDPSSTLGGIQPCPLCSGGACVGGPNNGLACTAGTTALTPSYPTSNDCPPDPMFNIGTLAIGFSLSTGIVSWTGTPATNDSGSTVSIQSRVFSGFCRNINTGAFQNPAQQCWENGMAVGPACTFPADECEQRTNGAFGPNGNASRTITEIGSPQTGIFFGPAAGTMVSVFSIPQTFDATVDAVGDLPGPGAVALPGSGTLCTTAASCP